jgi:hypothetical protein
MRADIHDGPEHNTLQSEAGYIDARPYLPDRRNLLAPHSRTIHWVRLGVLDNHDLCPIHRQTPDVRSLTCAGSSSSQQTDSGATKNAPECAPGGVPGYLIRSDDAKATWTTIVRSCHDWVAKLFCSGRANSLRAAEAFDTSGCGGPRQCGPIHPAVLLFDLRTCL